MDSGMVRQVASDREEDEVHETVGLGVNTNGYHTENNSEENINTEGIIGSNIIDDNDNNGNQETYLGKPSKLKTG